MARKPTEMEKVTSDLRRTVARMRSWRKGEDDKASGAARAIALGRCSEAACEAIEALVAENAALRKKVDAVENVDKVVDAVNRIKWQAIQELLADYHAKVKA